MEMITALLLAILFFHLNSACEVTSLSHEFVRCQDSDICSGTVLNTVIGISTIQCAAACVQNGFCRALSVCAQGNSLEHVTCRLLDNAVSGSIGTEEISSVCIGMKRLRCENGGTVLSGQCRCPLGFAGVTCDRRIRDCKESLENGYSLSGDTALLIQPAGAPAPFWIICRLSNGVSYPFKRMSQNFTVDWTTAKTRNGDDLSVKNISNDYFIGLDNLHYLLKQAEYLLNVYCLYNKSNIAHAYYTNFSIGNESSNYAFTYQTFSSHSQYFADNGFYGLLPLVFCTNDHDTNSCRKGYPGWFSSNCTGYSLFADRLVWPINGSATNIEAVSLALTRFGTFSVN